MEIKIWGCKGSHITPGKNYQKYGGNTPCIELESGEKDLIFLMLGLA